MIVISLLVILILVTTFLFIRDIRLEFFICPPNSSRLSAKNSIETDTKSWCGYKNGGTTDKKTITYCENELNRLESLNDDYEINPLCKVL